MAKVNNSCVIAWFSCGITSAVACKMALESYDNVRVFYIDTGGEHEDSKRFLRDCEKWFGVSIEVRRNKIYNSPFDVWKKRRYLNGVAGAPCTLELKKKVRYAIEDEVVNWDAQVFGFDVSEQKRFKRFTEQYPQCKAVAPLIESSLSKEDCLAIVRRSGIIPPLMYQLGFHNNNCIGCVKGKKGYWNKIRRCFPETFYKMAAFEREIGHSCINGCFLDELEYVDLPPLVESCSIFCEVEFSNLD